MAGKLLDEVTKKLISDLSEVSELNPFNRPSLSDLLEVSELNPFNRPSLQQIHQICAQHLIAHHPLFSESELNTLFPFGHHPLFSESELNDFSHMDLSSTDPSLRVLRIYQALAQNPVESRNPPIQVLPPGPPSPTSSLNQTQPPSSSINQTQPPSSSSPSSLPQRQPSNSFPNMAPRHPREESLPVVVANQVPVPHHMDALSWVALGHCLTAGTEFNAIFAQVADPNIVSPRVRLMSLLVNIALCLLIAANGIFARTHPTLALRMDRLGSIMVLVSSIIAAMPTIPLYVSIGCVVFMIIAYAHQRFFP